MDQSKDTELLAATGKTSRATLDTLGRHAQTDVSGDEMVRIQRPIHLIFTNPTTRRGVTVSPSAASKDRLSDRLE